MRPLFRPTLLRAATRSIPARRPLSLSTTRFATPAPPEHGHIVSSHGHEAGHDAHEHGSDHGSGHGDHYDAPGGWLWGIRPGEKPEKEGWEPFMWILYGSLGLLTVAIAFQPDTSLDTWALEEARRRLEKEGILPDPFPDHKEKE